jgi:hypothetical protein
MPRVSKKQRTQKWTPDYLAGYHAAYKRTLRRLQGISSRDSVIGQVKSADYKRGERDGEKVARQGVKKGRR